MQIPRLRVPALWLGVWPMAIVLVGFSFAGCRDKNQPLPDPCAGQRANPLTMQFIEAFGTPTPDTACNNQPVALRGPGAPYTSYKWLVGAVDQRTGRTVVVSFDQFTLGSIPVRLIATRPPNTACFKNDDGVDTLTQTLTLMPERDPRAPIYGKFRGANKDTPRDTFTVRTYEGPDFRYPNNPSVYSNYVAGIPKGCLTPYRYAGFTWRGMTATSGGCTSFDITKGYITTRDSIRIEYRAQVTPTIIDKIFLGKRVR